MSISQVIKRGAKFELVIKKGYGMLKPFEIAFINPTPLENAGQFCPVAILTLYMASRYTQP